MILLLCAQYLHPYLRVTLAIEDSTLTIVNAHPPVVFGPGATQIPDRPDIQVLAEMIVDDGTTILMGDFNFTDQNRGYGYLKRAGLTDAFRSVGVGLGLTYPKKTWGGEPFPLLVRLDYILTTSELAPAKAWVGSDAGSDHLPVMAILSWEP